LSELYNKYCSPNASDVIRISKDDRAKNLFGEGGFTKVEFDNNLIQPYEGLLGGSLSASYSPKPGDENYEPYVQGLRELFDKYSRDGLIETKFRTVCFYGKLS
jgi:hypothetical protein